MPQNGNIGQLNIILDASIAGLVSGVNTANAQLTSLQTQANNATNALKNMIAGAIGIYAVSSAFKELLTSGMEANRMMENSEGKLFAMINSSKDYVDIQGNQLTANERLGAVNRETAMTMDLLTKANAETSMGMTELIDVYALMKPGMDRNKVAIQDQIQILKMVTNTAANFGVGADELSNGIDDLADGTWKSNSGFGKMMKSLQLTQDEVKNTDNLLALLNNRMAETGAASDNMDTALSNLDVAWGNITGTLTKDIFGATKESIKVLTNMMGTDGVLASQAYAQSFKSLANFAVTSIGFIIKAINQMITLMQVAYKGYQQLGNYVATQGDKVGVAWNKAAVAVGEFVGLDVTEDKKDLADYNKAITERVGITKKLTEESNRIINANDNINNSVNTMVASFTTYKAVVKETNDIQVNNKSVVKAIDEVEKKVAKGTKAHKKAISDIEKAQKKANKDAIKDMEDLANRQAEIFSDMFKNILDGDISGAFSGFFKSVGNDMMSPMIDSMSEKMGSMLSGLTNGLGSIGGFLTGGLLSFGGSVIGGLLNGFLNTEEVAPDLGSDGSKGSESLSNALNNMNKVMYENLKYTKRMTASLSSIDKAFGGLGNELAGMNLSASGFKDSSSSGFLGFSSKSTELQGTSIKIAPASIDKMINGQIKATSDVVTKVSKSSFFGLSSSVSYDTTTTDISASMNEYFTEATKGLVNTFKVAGDILNVSLSGLGTNKLDIGKFDTSGKSGEEIAKLVEGGFSAEADRLAQNYFPMVQQFVQAGEKYVEALVRTSINFEQIGYQIGQMGKKVTYESSQAIIGVFGTLEDAQSGISSYIDLFYSSQEKADLQIKDMQNTFNTLGVTMPKTNAEFRKLVDSIDTTTEAGATMYGELTKLAPQFSDMTQTQKDLAQAEIDRLDEVNSKIVSMYTGSLSYLNSLEKSKFLEGSTDINSLEDKLALDKKLSTSREEYAIDFDTFINNLSNKEEEKTTTDVVNSLAELKIQNERIEEAITKASFQS